MDSGPSPKILNGDIKCKPIFYDMQLFFSLQESGSRSKGGGK